MSNLKGSFILSAALGAITFICSACSSDQRPENSSVAKDGVLAKAAAAMPDEERWNSTTVMAGHEVDGLAVLTAVRTAKHPQYERVVFEFRGNQLPNYRVRYIDKPETRCGSGETVELEGTSWLEIRFEPAAVYDENGQPTLTKRSVAPAMSNLARLELTCDFESALTWIGWLGARNRFRVLELSAPPRLVLDVR